MNRRLVIAIIAHNEADEIGPFLSDLRRQTVFDQSFEIDSTDVFIVANGCSDNTAEHAEARFTSLAFPERSRLRIVEIPAPSKTNAWNVFMHTCLPADADFVVMMDADVRLPQPDLIARSIAALEAHPEAMVASDVSIKDFRRTSRANLFRYLWTAFENFDTSRAKFCGQFYCARAHFLRDVALPIGLLSQDGFLRAMILTSGLTHPEDLQRIYDVPGAQHLHPAYSRLSSIFRYQKRQAIGTAIYLMIYAELETMPSDFTKRMNEIRRRNAENPDWVAQLIANRSAAVHRLVPDSYRWRKLDVLQDTGSKRWLKWFALLPSLAFDLWVARCAEAELRSGGVGSVKRNQGKFKIRG